jgi:drug/metabolite transporter (DMT)-like permease
MHKNSKVWPVLAGISLSFIFGFSFLFSKDALDVTSPFELLAHRFTLAVLLLILLIWLKAIKFKLSGSLVRDLLPLTLFQPIIYFVGETFGVKLTSASESGLVIALIPVAVTAFGDWFLGEKVNLRYWFYISLSVLGVIIIVLANSGLEFGTHTVGILNLVMAVIGAAIYNIWSRKLSKRYNPVEITVAMMASGAVFFNLIYLITEKPGAHYFKAFFQLRALPSLLYLGLLSSVGAFFLLNYMLSRMTASKTASFVNLTTIVSVAAGVFFRGESFGLLHLIGGIFILAGVWKTTIHS